MKTLVILIFLFSNIFSKDFDKSFKEANNYYNKSKYLESIKIFESILADGWESSNLYYNLGNSYFRQNQIGQSIWAYNKALKMDPRNIDLIKNISIAQARVKDRIILPDEFYFVKIYGKFKSRYILKEWLLIGGVIVLFTVISFLFSEFRIINNLII
jgi:Tetratricopeptide repeat.